MCCIWAMVGLTREEVITILGEPDEIAATTRRRKYPLIFKYGNYEYYFEDNKDGKCVSIDYVGDHYLDKNED